MSPRIPAEFHRFGNVLRQVLEMLGRAEVKLASADSIGYRPPIETDSQTASFPSRIAFRPTLRENLTIYRLIAAQHAGRLQFGTLGFDLDRFLGAFEEPAVARQLFLVFDGLRVDYLLARAHRGLATDLHWLSRLGKSDPQDALVGTVEQLQVALAPLRPSLLVALHHSAALVTADNAGVGASARATRDLYRAMHKAVREGLLLMDWTAPQSNPRAAMVPGAADASNGRLLRLKTPEELAGQESVAGEEKATAQAAAAGANGDLASLSLDQLLEILRRGSQSAQGSDQETTSNSAAGICLDGMVSDGGVVNTDSGDAPLRLLNKAVPRRTHRSEDAFVYDEWDYELDSYRSMWCTLSETLLRPLDETFFSDTLRRHSSLLAAVRRQFQQIKPAGYRTVKRLEEGEDFDLTALVDARADRRAGHTPSSRLYVARKPEERDVATLFLLDMSASTDQPVVGKGSSDKRRIIDINKEALVIMAEALEQIGDGYAVYGFSGHSRHQVEFYVIKRFTDRLSKAIKGRISAIEPKRSTRMGTALRHAIGRMKNLPVHSKHIILLSDGFPQDIDYGDDRRSKTYGIRDTMMAIHEAGKEGITTFCVTVDKTGHDYLKDICTPSRYMVIENVESLVEQLPKIYQSFIYS